MISDTVIIMGVSWKILLRKPKEDDGLKGIGGYCDITTKTIVIRKQREAPRPNQCGDLREYERGCLRHEIVHAMLFESGLAHNSKETSKWAMNEEMVDWIAQQHEKIHTAFIESGAILQSE